MCHIAYCNYIYPGNANYIYTDLCNDADMDTIAQRIFKLRHKSGYTQAQLAKYVLVSRVAVTKWESGDTENLKLNNLMKLCDLFGVSPQYLITGDESNNAVQVTTNDIELEDMNLNQLVDRLYFLNNEVEKTKRQLAKLLNQSPSDSLLLNLSNGQKKNK